MDYAPFWLSKKWLAPLFRGFHSSLRLRRGQGAMQGNPCYAWLFADLPYTPQGAFSCPFGTIHLVPPNPIKAPWGQSRAPPVAGGARRKPSEQGSARKAPRADAARPLRTALRPPNPRGFFDRLNGAWTMLRFLFYIIFSSVFRFPGPRLPGAYTISRRESAAAGPHRSDLDFSSGSAPPAPPPWFPSYPRFWKGCRPAGRYRGWS